MTLISSPKIKPWAEALKEIKDAIDSQSERPSIAIPYGLQLENDLWNPENLRAAVHVSSSSVGDCFLSHHGVGTSNKLNLWTITTAKDSNISRTRLKTFPTPFKFQHLLFITKRWIYVSYCVNMTLQVFSSKFVRISSAFTGRTLLSLEYNSNRDEILGGIAGGIMIWHFPVKQTDQLIPGRIIDCTFSCDEWTMSLKVDPWWNQILALSREKIAVLETKDYECQISFSRKSETSLTSCVLYNPLNYFVIGDQNGLIKAMSSSLASLPQITQFLGHCDAITSLVTHPREPLLISGSLDKTIRIWNFDTFAQTFCLQTGEEIIHVDLINSSKLFYRSEHSIKVWHMNLFHTLYTTLSSKIIKFMRVESPEYPSRIVVHAIDGGIRLISPVNGCELTAMLPITTLSSSIEDVCHDRRRELIYIVLNSREVLVFESNSNPCCASQLWRAEYQDEGVCSIALLNAEYALGKEDLELEFSLLFAGHYNGQISLLDGHGVEMKTNVQAHQGQIVRLCSSHGHNVSNDTLESRDHLVSLGRDSLIRVWMVRHVVQRAINIELKSEVRLLTIPTEISMIGNIVCMVMDDFRVVMARVNVKSKGVFAKDKPCKFLFHSKDEGHTAAINGLSSCSDLKLFATSSDDQSVKVWNTKNQLVRELNFDNTLCGVCFANRRGDLLVGFQCHISLVTLTNYLPRPYLEVISSMHFDNEPIERNVQFDDHLEFWYDPKMVPTLPLDLSQRRPLLPPEITPCPWEQDTDSGSEELLIPTIEEDGLNWLRCASRRMSLMSRGSLASRLSMVSRAEPDDGRLSAFMGSKASSLMDALQVKDHEDLESKKSVSRTGQQSEENLTNQEGPVMSRADLEALFRPPHFWPCAPDCYIPNSVIRKFIKFRSPPAHMIPQLIRPEKERKIRKKEKKKSEDSETKKGARRRLFPGKKIKPAPKPKSGLKSAEKSPEFKPRSIPSPAARTAELRRRRGTLPVSQPDAIFEEMSEGEEEKEEEEEEVEEEEEISPVPEMRTKRVEIEEEVDVIDYGERDYDYDSISSSSEEEITLEIEEKKERKLVVKEKVLSDKPEVRYLFAPKPPPESILQKVVRRSWYPVKRKIKIEVNEVINNLTKVLHKEDASDFEEMCKDLVSINRKYTISEEKKSILHDILLKKTWHQDAEVRKIGIETLRLLNMKKKDTTLAMISRIVDEDKAVRDEAKEALRDLHDIYTIDDLANTLMKFGVVSFLLPCSDNVNLSELMDRLRRIKEVKKKKKQIEKTQAKQKKKKHRIPAKRRESPFAARRRSIKAPRIEASPSEAEDIFQELNQTNLGCKLLQQLSPVSTMVYTHYGGSQHSLSTRSSLEGMGLSVAGKSLRTQSRAERISTLSSRESSRQAGMAKSSADLSSRLDASPSAITATAAKLKTRTLEAMLCGSEAVRRHSQLRRSIDEAFFVPPSSSLIARSGKIKGKKQELEEKEEDDHDLEIEYELDELHLTLDEFVEVLNEIKTNQVGRALLFSLMHMKGQKQSKKRILFYIPDIFNMFSQLPDIIKQEKPVFTTVGDLLQSKLDVEEFNDKNLKVKLKQSILSELLQARMDFQGRNEQMANVEEILEKYREELFGSQGSAEDAGQTCTVSIADLMWVLSNITSKEDRKNFIRKVILDALDQLEHLKLTPQRPQGKLDQYVARKEIKRLHAEGISPSAVDQGKKDKLTRVMRLQKRVYREKELTIVSQHISTLRTPVRRNLVPGIRGERLAHSLDVNRPFPYNEIERLMTEQIVKSLPYRLSFHTGAREWGQSNYGILEITWTSKGPKYTISDVNINGKAFPKNMTKYMSDNRTSRENGRQNGSSEQPLNSLNANNTPANRNTGSLPSISRSRLQNLSTPVSIYGFSRLQNSRTSDFGLEPEQQNQEGGVGKEGTFCISDTYSTPSSNTLRNSSNFTLPSLSTGSESSPLSSGSTSRDKMTSQEIYLPSMSLVKEGKTN